jgi:hypothetical protein
MTPAGVRYWDVHMHVGSLTLGEYSAADAEITRRFFEQQILTYRPPPEPLVQEARRIMRDTRQAAKRIGRAARRRARLRGYR